VFDVHGRVYLATKKKNTDNINNGVKRTNWRRRANAKSTKAGPEFATNAHQVKEREVSRLGWDWP
jgi:hypothetical protein